MRATVVAFVVVVLIITIAAVGRSRAGCASFLTGLWIGEPTFLEKSQLSEVQLFVAPPAPGSPQRDAYLLVVGRDGEFIADGALEMSFTQPLWSSLGAAMRPACGVCRMAVALDFGDGAAPLPGKLRAALSVADGTLALYDASKVYAFLTKDNAASAAALAVYTAE